MTSTICSPFYQKSSPLYVYNAISIKYLLQYLSNIYRSIYQILFKYLSNILPVPWFPVFGKREEREVSRAQQLLSPEKLIIMLSVQIFSNISQQFKMIPNILPKIFFKTSFHNVAFNASIIPILIQLSNIALRELHSYTL